MFHHFVNAPDDDTFLLIIQGTTRIGKYALIHLICHALSTARIGENNTILLLAITSLDSFNIDGKTIHLV